MLQAATNKTFKKLHSGLIILKGIFLLQLTVVNIHILSRVKIVDHFFILIIGLVIVYAVYIGNIAGNDEHDEFSPWTVTRTRDHIVEIENAEYTNPFATDSVYGDNSVDDPVSQFIDSVPNSENQSAGDPPEMYLPGFVIHVVPEQKRPQTDLKTTWRTQERGRYYRAYIANRESFKDIIVSPSMFLDHLPWRYGKL